MHFKPLGSSGIDASVVGLGTWAIGGWMWGGTEEKKAVSGIHAAIDAGVNLVDTAPVYGFGTSEKIVGKAIKDRRDKVVLATKCGLVWDKEKGDFYFHTDEENVRARGGTMKVYKYLGPESIRDEVEKSLKRLQTDYIDLYQTHWQESTTPIEDTMGTLLELKKEGKIRAIGVSNVTVEQLEKYRAAGAVDSDQELYSMLDRDHEDDLLPYCADNDIAFLAYSPLAQGLLTGKVTPDREFAESDQRSSKKRFSKDNRQKVLDMLEAYRSIAERHGISFAQLAIAWTVHQRGCSHALVGARDAEQAQENAKAGSVDLSDEEVNIITDAIDTFAGDVP